MIVSDNHVINVQPNTDKENNTCYICLEDNNNVYSPCKCNSFVHPHCLMKWITHKPIHKAFKCEICMDNYTHITMYIPKFYITIKFLYIMGYVSVSVILIYLLNMIPQFSPKSEKYNQGSAIIASILSSIILYYIGRIIWLRLCQSSYIRNRSKPLIMIKDIKFISNMMYII